MKLPVALQEVALLIVEELDVPRAERELRRRSGIRELPFPRDIRYALDLAVLGDEMLIGQFARRNADVDAGHELFFGKFSLSDKHAILIQEIKIVEA